MNRREIVDSRGKPIMPRSVVSLCDPNHRLYEYQGLVIKTGFRSDKDRVAVFFYNEADFLNFGDAMHAVQDWDELHRDNMPMCDDDERFSEPYFIRTCPRVCVFSGKDLLIRRAWLHIHLANRLFPNAYMSLGKLPPGIHRNPTRYQCFSFRCKTTATQTALFNVNGFVFPWYVCDDCFSGLHGHFSADSKPRMNEPLLFANGTPVTR